MTEFYLIFGAGLLALLSALGFQRQRLRQKTRERLDRNLDSSAEAFAEQTRTLSAWFWTFGVFVTVTLALKFTLDRLSWELALSLAFVAATVAWGACSSLLSNRALRLEQQLADAFDLMTAGLLSGASTVEALESAGRESPMPLRDLLLDVTGRLRLGARPNDVLDELAAKAPLDSMRLFVQVLKVQWQVGGALTPAIAAVAHTVRDRIDVSRRIRSQSAEVRFSVVAILAVVYGIAALTWTNNPDKVEAFATSEIGSPILAMTVILQGFGLLWIQRLSQVNR